MAVNPWDIRTALLAKHAQHVVLIHFPIALFLSGVIFDVAAAWTRREELASVAYWNLTGAVLGVIPAALTGLLAWQLELKGRALKGILLLHLLAATASAVFIIGIWYSHYRRRRQPESTRPTHRLPLELLGVVTITLTGYLGGFLSGVNH